MCLALIAIQCPRSVLGRLNLLEYCVSNVVEVLAHGVVLLGVLARVSFTVSGSLKGLLLLFDSLLFGVEYLLADC